VKTKAEFLALLFQSSVNHINMMSRLKTVVLLINFCVNSNTL